MPDLADGETVEVKGSAVRPYVLKNSGGIYSCSCPAWRNQSIAPERRTCKHLKKLRGEAAELARTGADLPADGASAGVEALESDAEVAAGPLLLLAERWDNSQDLTGWWLSEKLDGVRAYWNGTALVSRLGNTFRSPDWFVEGLPPFPLDGELWIARKAFQKTVGIVRRHDRSDLWREVCFLVFDAPGLELSFEERLEAIRGELARGKPQFARAHDQIRCDGMNHMREELDRIESLGGEGLMVRQPGSHYEVGRSTTLLKIKSFRDAEARVIGHQKGAGRHKGRLGALLVELPDGTQFAVGTGLSDAERERPPAIGATITFRYQELSDRGVPRFPSYVGLRCDAATALSSTVSPAESSSSPGGVRRFELVEGTSNKFWEVDRNGCEVTVRYGRIGSTGQSKTKSFATEGAALEHAADLVAEKLGKGYSETPAG